jgi:hypothetical protein
MWEDVVETQLDQCQLDVVTVGAEILHCVQSLTQATKGFAKIGFDSFGNILPSVVDRSIERVLDITGRGGPYTMARATLVCNVVLHSGHRIDGKFVGMNWWTETSFVSAGIAVVGIVLWVVYKSIELATTRLPDFFIFFLARHKRTDMFLWTVNTQSLVGNLKLGSRISETHKRQNPYDNTDGRWLRL